MTLALSIYGAAMWAGGRAGDDVVELAWLVYIYKVRVIKSIHLRRELICLGVRACVKVVCPLPF